MNDLPQNLPVAPETEGIKYIGAKTKLIPYILYLARKTDAKTVYDAFSGTTRVSQAFAKSGYRVISNDIAIWAEVFGTCYLKNTRPPTAYQELINHLNSLSPIDGWFTEHYGGVENDGFSVQGDAKKRPWQVHNTRKLDAIREEIERLKLAPVERAVALTSLMLALDRVDNTLGHFASYLKKWSPRSYQQLNLRVPLLFENREAHQVLRGDVFRLSQTVVADLAYFDPPYGANNRKMPATRVRYAAYYHIWTSVCQFDKPSTFGQAMRRTDTRDQTAVSPFEEFRENVAKEAIHKLVQETQAEWILFSYGSNGKVSRCELFEILSSAGKIVEFFEIPVRKNVMSEMRWTDKWQNTNISQPFEYLFLVKK